MTETMYDSTTASDIPADARKVAGYLNGDYRWSAQDWLRFQRATRVSINVYIPGKVTVSTGDVLDIEEKYVEKDPVVTRAVAEKWVGDRIAMGAHPTLYVSVASLYNFRGLFCSFWVADYTGEPHMVSRAGFDIVGTQYASPSTGSGGHYDLSLTEERWPIQGGSIMDKMLHFESSKSGQGYWIVTVDGVYAYGDIANVTGHPDPMLTKDNFFAFVQTPSGQGYWLVDKAGNVFTYGDAPFFGHP